VTVPIGLRRAGVAAAAMLLAAGGILFALRAGGLLTQRDRTWERILASGVLRVGMDASYPPFEMENGDGTYAGYDVDLARALAARWGVRAEFVNVHLDGLYDALRAGKCDVIISAIPYDRTMTRDVLYSTAYLNAGLVLVVREGSGISSADDLRSRRVAVELGSEGHLLARRLARDDALTLDIVTAREPAEMPALMREPSISALICDRVQALGYLAEQPGWEITGAPLTDEPYVIAAPLGAHTLLANLDAALAEWREDGTLAALEQRWLH